MVSPQVVRRELQVRFGLYEMRAEELIKANPHIIVGAEEHITAYLIADIIMKATLRGKPIPKEWIEPVSAHECTHG